MSPGEPETFASNYIYVGDTVSNTVSWDSSSYSYPDADIEKILEEVYQLGFENGGSAMKRLLNGKEKDEKTKSAFELLKQKLLNLFSSLVTPTPRYIPYDQKPYTDDYWRVTAGDSTTTYDAVNTSGSSWVSLGDNSRGGVRK